MVFQAVPPCVLQKIPENPEFYPFHLFFFGLCDLEICHMTLEIWEPQAVGVSNYLIKYNVIGDETCSQRLGETDRQKDGRTVCRSEERRTLHTITPNKWPKHKRKKTTENSKWCVGIYNLRRCQTNVLSSYVYHENIIFTWSKEKGDFFRFQRCV